MIDENYQVALGNLNNAGFTNIQVVHVSNPQWSNGTVVLQNPTAGQRVPASTQITLSVVQNAASPEPDADDGLADARRRPRRRPGPAGPLTGHR